MYNNNNSTQYQKYQITSNIEGKNIIINFYEIGNKYNYSFGNLCFMPHYYLRTDFFIFVYDISNRSTFVEIKRISLNYKERFEDKNGLRIIVGNKIDKQRREVTKNEAEKFATENKFLFTEISALTGEGIDDLITVVKENILKRVLDDFYLSNDYNLCNDINNKSGKTNDLNLKEDSSISNTLTINKDIETPGNNVNIENEKINDYSVLNKKISDLEAVLLRKRIKNRKREKYFKF